MSYVTKKGVTWEWCAGGSDALTKKNYVGVGTTEENGETFAACVVTKRKDCGKKKSEMTIDDCLIRQGMERPFDWQDEQAEDAMELWGMSSASMGIDGAVEGEAYKTP